jgi:starch synthase (maltosyl-transferring)
VRVLFVIDSLGSGGAQRQVVELAATFAARGSPAPAVLTYYDDGFFADRLARAGMPLVLARRRGRFDLPFVRRLRRAIDDLSPDVVHAFLHAPVAWTWLAMRGMKRRPRLIVAERVVLSAIPTLARPLMRHVYRSADAITANAACAAAEIREQFGISNGVHVIGNGIDLAAWDAAAGQELSPPLADADFRIALVGGLRQQKNHALLLDALSYLGPDRTKGWRVFLVGADTGGEADAQEVRRRVAESRLSDRVTLLGPVRNVAALMCRLDAVVLTSDYEGFPNVVLEAMASRLPVVATDVGAVPELVVGGETGFIVPRGATRPFAESLVRLSTLAPDERRAMGAAARRVVEARYAMARIADDYVRVYESVVAA